jgi:parallel beta-helix repeat protein
VHQEEEPMQALRRTATVVLFPAIACLVAACEHTGLPTEPQSTVGVVPPVNDATFSGVVWWVDDDPSFSAVPGGSCNDPSYNTIQAAVGAADPGDRINVCPGTYTEQVTIPTGKDNIQLRSTKRWEAIIKAPTVMVPVGGRYTIVRISSSQNVTILGFTITGPGPTGCASLHYGVKVDNAASANILGNHITQIRDEPFSGCQNGVAVLVGRTAELTTGSAHIIGNVFDNYQKNGPTVDYTGSWAEIRNNRVLGIGPTTLTAQNGIQVSGGATASIRHNFVAGNNYTPGTPTSDESSGILLFQSGDVATEHNTVTGNGVGIYIYEPGTGSTTTKNHIRGGNNDGVAIDCTSNCSLGSQVTDNKIQDNAGPGIGLYNGVQGNMVDDNHAGDNAGGGILLDKASNNTVSDNKVKDNGTDGADVTDGIRVSAVSAGNTISKNHMKHNVTHDCHDDSGVPLAPANTWTDNRGETSNRPGLCNGADDDAAFATTTTYGWDASYPWATDFGDAADFDWVAAYATIDTDSLLQLLPTVRISGIHAATPSPAR